MRMRAAQAPLPSGKLAMEDGESGVGEFWIQVKQNLQLKSFIGVWNEVSGAVGDLGTFVPLLLTLAFVNGVDLGTTLIFTGLYNIATGILFGIPMPVQPMKYIFAAAIANPNHPMTVPQIMAAGLWTGLALFVCGATGLMDLATRLVPTSVIRGFQLSQGISFGITAVHYIALKQDFTTGLEDGRRDWLGSDGIVVALCALAFVILASGPGEDTAQSIPGETTAGSRGSLTQSLLDEVDILHSVAEEDEEESVKGVAADRAGSVAIPSALIVFALGTVLALVRYPGALADIRLGPSVPVVMRISWEDWRIGLVRGASAQIPLSLISTVVAVTKLSHSLFPEKTNVTATSVSTAVGLFNLAGCWFGTLPVECGAGGLAAQFRFGARDGYAVIMLGSAKLLTGLLLGSSLLRLLASFPIGLLGVLLLLAGSELAMFCRDQTSRLDAFVMVVCATAALAGLSAPLGFTMGCATFLLLKCRQFLYSRAAFACGNGRWVAWNVV